MVATFLFTYLRIRRAQGEGSNDPVAKETIQPQCVLAKYLSKGAFTPNLFGVVKTNLGLSG